MARRLTWLTVLSVVAMLLCGNAIAQSIVLDTTVATIGLEYRYDFDVTNAGASGTLTSDIWDWYMFLDTAAPAPTDTVSPAGWQFAYDGSSGELHWFTEGPGGAANGDFGPNTIPVGSSLGGFGLTSVLAPDLSIVFAQDTAGNWDLNFATIPVNLPQSVPEPDATFIIGCGLVAGTLCYRRGWRWSRS